jgi:hypothetical protein
VIFGSGRFNPGSRAIDWCGTREFPWHIAGGAKTGFVSGPKSGDGYKFPLAFAPADVIADHFETYSSFGPYDRALLGGLQPVRKQLPRTTSLRPLHPKVRIGHVHLKVADLERALDFYRDVLGFQVTQRHGQEAAFLSAGGYHHHIGLNTWESSGGSPPPPGATGLYHLAILYPTRQELLPAMILRGRAARRTSFSLG